MEVRVDCGVEPFQAADQLRCDGLADRATLVGLDLVDHLDPGLLLDPPLRLVCASVTAQAPTRRFDLITCVHGLHHIGDKLVVPTRFAELAQRSARQSSWLVR